VLRKAIYPKIESLLNTMAGWLNARGFSPNQLTLAGLVLNFVVGWIYASGWLFLGGVALILAGFGDVLDGPLARVSSRVSKFGAFLDSTVDRYSDFFIFGGIAAHYARTGEAGWFILTLGILLGSFVTSYSKARAENVIEKCDVGLFERAERVIILALGSLISFLFPVALWILFLGTNTTAIQRILYTRKKLSETP
jgi:CDP-diacylglycerol--glycerol-3-phosphate 3-phosphatidyltransferase